MLVKVLMVAEIEVDDDAAQDDDDRPGRDADVKLDAFREAVLPSENYGVTLYKATPDDVYAFASVGKLTHPAPLVVPGVTCAVCSQPVPADEVFAGMTVGSAETARDLGVDVGDFVCGECKGQ